MTDTDDETKQPDEGLEQLQASDGDDVDDATHELTAGDEGLSTRQEYQMRFALSQALGENLPVDDEDYYDVFNWDKHPGVDEFYSLALRNPYAYAVAFLPVETAWRNPPEIVDTGSDEGDSQTAFETAVSELVDDLRLWHYCRRAHKLSRLGKFGCLVMQFDDIDRPSELDQPVGNASTVTGLRPFSRVSIDQVKVGGPTSDRWGKPTSYKLDFSDENETEGVIEHEGPETVWVHWQRVIHIPSDELLDDEIRGVPALKPVYNNLIDIERTLGSAGQLAYRATAWGIHLDVDKDFELEDGGDSLRDQLQRWRWLGEDVLRTQGVEAESLGGENIDPQPIIDPNIEALSTQTGIPQSVLKGNETGERATTQDLKEWYGKIGEDQDEFITPQIVREIIDRWLWLDLIPDPSGTDGYEATWESLHETSDEDVAKVQERRSKTIQALPDLERELTAAEQAEWLESGTLPNDLNDRIEQRDVEQDEMGQLPDVVEVPQAEQPGDD